MKIVVCLKQVPDTTAVKIDPKTGTLIRDGVPSIIIPEDKHALEAALQLKDNNGAEVTVLSMGPPQAKSALREAPPTSPPSISGCANNSGAVAAFTDPPY